MRDQCSASAVAVVAGLTGLFLVGSASGRFAFAPRNSASPCGVP